MLIEQDAEQRHSRECERGANVTFPGEKVLTQLSAQKESFPRTMDRGFCTGFISGIHIVIC